jgi:hypothetical protein
MVQGWQKSLAYPGALVGDPLLCPQFRVRVNRCRTGIGKDAARPSEMEAFQISIACWSSFSIEHQGNKIQSSGRLTATLRRQLSPHVTAK